MEGKCLIKNIACLNIIFSFVFLIFFFLVSNAGLLVARKEVELGVGAACSRMKVGGQLTVSAIALGFFVDGGVLGTLVRGSIFFGHGCIGFFFVLEGG